MPVRTERGFDRLLTFADAVVAIALTLLVLPLSEVAADLRGRDVDVGTVVSDHGEELGAFVLSFVVIWVLWTLHHRIMEYFRAYDGVLSRLTLVWLFTIVVLPFVTQLLTGEQYSRGAVPVYDGVLLISSLSLSAMAWWGQRHPELLEDSDEVRTWRAEPVVPVVPVLLLIAMVLAIFVPAIGSWPLFALVLDDRLEHAWLRLRGHR